MRRVRVVLSACSEIDVFTSVLQDADDKGEWKHHAQHNERCPRREGGPKTVERVLALDIGQRNL